MDKEICCLCKKQIMFSNSHNAHPVKDGRCCEDCNFRVVLVERLKLWRKDINENR